MYILPLPSLHLPYYQLTRHIFLIFTPLSFLLHFPLFGSILLSNLIFSFHHPLAFPSFLLTLTSFPSACPFNPLPSHLLTPLQIFLYYSSTSNTFFFYYSFPTYHSGALG